MFPAKVGNPPRPAKEAWIACTLLQSGCTVVWKDYTLFWAALPYALNSHQIKDTTTMAKRIRMSDETLNCYGTWIKTGGIDLGQFQRNPVLLWMHRRGEIIGLMKDVRIENGEITGEPWFDEVREESKLAKQQYEKGTLRMGSPNFEIMEWSEEAELLKPGQTRPTVTKCKLVEYSMVDVGGNDNNIVLSYEGKTLQLAAGEPCDMLPLLKPKTNIHNSETKSQTEMNEQFKAIALKLGLPETATEAEILNRIGIVLAYQTANVELRKQLDELKLAGVTAMVDDAVKAGKFNADKRDHFIKLGKALGAEELKLTLDAMATVTKPMDIVGGGAGAAGMSLGKGAVPGQWKKLGEVPEAQLKLMRETNPEMYKQLFEAEYGIECPQLK